MLLQSALTLAACTDSPDTLLPPVSARGSQAPAAERSAAIPGEYIVVFRDGVSDAPGLSRRMVGAAGGTLRFTYTAALKGFAAKLPAAALAGIEHNPNVAYVEADQISRAAASGTQYGVGLSYLWNLDRIDELQRTFDGHYGYLRSGDGVHAYVIDSGVRTTHGQFGGRASTGVDLVWGSGSWGGSYGEDCDNHGTHVAGTLGGATFGVAKSVQIVSVKVLDCWGTTPNSRTVAGVDWVTANAIHPAVVNMSLGGGGSSAVDQAVRNSIASGITYVLAAGNSNTDACNTSPARVGEALTVGASDTNDAKATFSNYGGCVDLWAPGVGIRSAISSADNAEALYEGTSMAAPHVAGVVAQMLEERPNASPADVGRALWDASPDYVVSGIPGYDNRGAKLVYSRHSLVQISGLFDRYGAPGEVLTWGSTVWGAPATYTGYLWEESTDLVTWTAVGTGSTYSRYVGPYENFYLRLTADLAYRTVSTAVYVNHEPPPPPPTDCELYGYNC